MTKARALPDLPAALAELVPAEVLASASAGSAADQFEIGRLATQADLQAAADAWYALAAEQGHAAAQGLLGYALTFDRDGAPAQVEQGVAWLRQGAAQGDPMALYGLGEAYETGNGVPEDPKQAVRWYQLAADQGSAPGRYGLGGAYLTGSGVRANQKKAIALLTQAAEQGLAVAQVTLGRCYLLREDFDAAVPWLREAAAQGDADACFELGHAYDHGHGVEQDFQEAVRWYELAVAQGQADAQFNLALHYDGATEDEEGGVAADLPEAARLFRLAAEQGHVEACTCLGIALAEGKGIERDRKQARRWLEQAAEQDEETAVAYLRENFR